LRFSALKNEKVQPSAKRSRGSPLTPISDQLQVTMLDQVGEICSIQFSPALGDTFNGRRTVAIILKGEGKRDRFALIDFGEKQVHRFIGSHSELPQNFLHPSLT
jgi:hypothetical protein